MNRHWLAFYRDANEPPVYVVDSEQAAKFSRKGFRVEGPFVSAEELLREIVAEARAHPDFIRDEDLERIGEAVLKRLGAKRTEGEG